MEDPISTSCNHSNHCNGTISMPIPVDSQSNCGLSNACSSSIKESSHVGWAGNVSGEMVHCRVYAQTLVIHAGKKCSEFPMQEAYLRGQFLHVILTLPDLQSLDQASFASTIMHETEASATLADGNRSSKPHTAERCTVVKEHSSKVVKKPSGFLLDDNISASETNEDSTVTAPGTDVEGFVEFDKMHVASETTVALAKLADGEHNAFPKCAKSLSSISENVLIKVEDQGEQVYVAFVEDKCDDFEEDKSSYPLNPSDTEHGIFECDICKMTFALEDYLIRHRLRCRDPVMAKFKCSLCSSGFTSKNGLDMHVDTVHLKKREFGCAICGKLFTRKHILKIHYATHSGVQAFKCDVCNKSFNQKSNYTRHARIHEHKSKGYKCRYCGQSFSQNAYLKNHIRCHENMNTRIMTESECNNVYVVPNAS